MPEESTPEAGGKVRCPSSGRCKYATQDKADIHRSGQTSEDVAKINGYLDSLELLQSIKIEKLPMDEKTWTAIDKAIERKAAELCQKVELCPTVWTNDNGRTKVLRRMLKVRRKIDAPEGAVTHLIEALLLWMDKI